MDKTAAEKGADLHAAPQPGDGEPLPLQCRQGLLHKRVGPLAVVVRNRQMLQPQLGRLNRQLLRRQAAVAAGGVAMKIAPPRAATAVHRGQDRCQGMGKGQLSGAPGEGLLLCIPSTLAGVKLDGHCHENNKGRHQPRGGTRGELALENGQHHDHHQQQGGGFVQGPQLAAAPGAGPLLQLPHEPIAEQVVGQQQGHEGQLHMQPALVQPTGIGGQQADGHGHRHHHAGGGDDVGQPLLHQRVLGLEHRLGIGAEGVRLHVVDEETHQIEQPGKPHHHPDDVEGLEPEIGLWRQVQRHQGGGLRGQSLLQHGLLGCAPRLQALTFPHGK